jgi:hypothetical protein
MEAIDMYSKQLQALGEKLSKCENHHDNRINIVEKDVALIQQENRHQDELASQTRDAVKATAADVRELKEKTIPTLKAMILRSGAVQTVLVVLALLALRKWGLA